VLISTAAASNEDSRDPVVWLSEAAIHYHGPITKSGSQDLRITYAPARVPIQWLEITSNGGEINASMDLGDWVYANKINVRVHDHCLPAQTTSLQRGQSKPSNRTQLSLGMVLRFNRKRKAAKKSARLLNVTSYLEPRTQIVLS
jgi:hypothetical protein